MIEGGVDVLLLETMQDLLELKAAIAGIPREFAKGARRVPIQAQPTLDHRPDAARHRHPRDLRDARTRSIDVIVAELLDRPRPHARLDALPDRELAQYVSVIPNAGLPLMGPKGETIYPETPDELAGELADFVREFGVNVVGGCCGSTPAHIARDPRGRRRARARRHRGRTPSPNRCSGPPRR